MKFFLNNARFFNGLGMGVAQGEKRTNLRNGKRAACNHGIMDARGRLLSTKEAYESPSAALAS